MPPRISPLLVCLLLASSLAAQVREEIDVQILEIEATVLDREGKPVHDLKREDFEVRIGGTSVPVANFFLVRNGVIVNEDAPAAPAKAAAETSIPTSLLIFIDELHLSSGSRHRAIEALKRYVSANVGPNTTATLVRYYKHFDVRVLPTEKPGYILAELEKLAREPFADLAARERQQLIEQIDDVMNPPRNNIEAEANEKVFKAPTAYIDGSGGTLGVTPDMLFRRVEDYAERRTTEVDRTIMGVEKAIEYASAFAGRKVLLYVSDGLPQKPGLDMFEYWDQASRHSSGYKSPTEAIEEIGAARAPSDDNDPGTSVSIASPGSGARTDLSQAMRFDRSDAFRRLVKTAQGSDVAIYSFDAGGLRLTETGAQHAKTRQTINTVSISGNMRAGLQYVADETGGLYIANDNDIDSILARMSEQFTTYYSLGVRPERGDIRITVKGRPELRVIATRRRAPRTRQDELEQNVRQRLYTRQADNPLRAALHVGIASRADGQCVVPVRVGVPQPNAAPELTPQLVEVHMVMLNEHFDESAVQDAVVPFESGRAIHSMMLRIRPQRHVLSLAVLNPLSGESSYLQAEIDGTTCN